MLVRRRDYSGTIDGKFSNVEDFAKRVSTSKVQQKDAGSLIKSGGFDALGDRSDLLFNLENILAFASKLQKRGAQAGKPTFSVALQIVPKRSCR